MMMIETANRVYRLSWYLVYFCLLFSPPKLITNFNFMYIKVSNLKHELLSLCNIKIIILRRLCALSRWRLCISSDNYFSHKNEEICILVCLFQLYFLLLLVTATDRFHCTHIRGMFEMNCLFLSGDFKFQVNPKVLISCPRSTPRG